MRTREFREACDATPGAKPTAPTAADAVPIAMDTVAMVEKTSRSRGGALCVGSSDVEGDWVTVEVALRVGLDRVCDADTEDNT